MSDSCQIPDYTPREGTLNAVFLALNTMRGHCKTSFIVFSFFLLSDILYKYLKMRDRVLFPCPDPSSLTWAYNRYSNNYLFRRAKRKGKRRSRGRRMEHQGEKKDTFKKGFLGRVILFSILPGTTEPALRVNILRSTSRISFSQ